MLCCSHPSVAPGATAFLALLFTFLFTVDCEFFSFHDSTVTHGFGFYSKGTFVNGGISCYRYDETSLLKKDAAFEFARFTSTLAVILSIPAFLLLWLPVCAPGSCRRILNVSCGFSIVQGVLSILSMVALASEVCTNNVLGNKNNVLGGCRLGRDAHLCIAASLAWFLTAGLICFGPKEVPSTTDATGKTLDDFSHDVDLTKGTGSRNNNSRHGGTASGDDSVANFEFTGMMKSATGFASSMMDSISSIDAGWRTPSQANVPSTMPPPKPPVDGTPGGATTQKRKSRKGSAIRFSMKTTKEIDIDHDMGSISEKDLDPELV